MDKITLKSPAKLNLFLKVLGKRPDGYHRIETIFQRIDLCDTITLRKRQKLIQVTSDKPGLPTGEENIAYKAASLLLKKAHISSGVAIDIKKNIPIGAGLGGGSSNAATVLKGLNRLYDLGIGLNELVSLGRTCGSDVAFFVYDYSFAKGTSRGDVITPIRTSAKLWQVLAVPPFGISTKDIYESLRSSYKNIRMMDVDKAAAALRSPGLTNIGELLYNSLEDVVLSRHPDIRWMKETLINIGAAGALVSGSGSAVFGLTKKRKEAIELEEKLKNDMLAGKREWQVYVARTL